MTVRLSYHPSATQHTLQVEPCDAVVAAGCELAITVSALLDDVITFKDTLHVVVDEGSEAALPLEATGTACMHACMHAGSCC